MNNETKPTLASEHHAEPVSPELNPLVSAVYDSVYATPPNEFQAINSVRALLVYLASPSGRTNANCWATDLYFCLEDEWPMKEGRWLHLSPVLQEALESLGEGLHDTISSPAIAERLGATPEQQLVRLAELEKLITDA